MRPPSEPLAVFTPRDGRGRSRPHLRMPTLILSTLALLGCAFLIYVFFHWLRDELNPKRRVKRGNRRPRVTDLKPPYVISLPTPAEFVEQRFRKAPATLRGSGQAVGGRDKRFTSQGQSVALGRAHCSWSRRHRAICNRSASCRPRPDPRNARCGWNFPARW